MPYFPLTQEDEATMLETVGVKTFDDLLVHIPNKLLHPEIRIPASPGEMAVQKEMALLSSENLNAQDTTSFLGAGLYHHFIPSALDHILRRGEFLTAYTPYQAEASQGTLQVIYEFQTLICRLTGMDVSNASHYDGSTALAEAVLLTLHHTGRSRVLLSSLLHPQYKQVIRTYLREMENEVLEIPFTSKGVLDRDFTQKNLNDNTACLVLSTPNFFGVVENTKDLSEKVHQVGGLMIASVNPMSLSFFASPREWGADIARK